MSNYTRVYFEGLGIDFDLPSVAFSIGSYDVHWYGIIIAFGFVLAVLYGGRMAYKWKMSLDGMTDVLIWGTIFGIIGARIYYVAFEWSYYKEHLAEIPQIWNGGIAIYGGIIGAIIGAAIGCKIGKINFHNLLDLGALGLLIGQGIGRWGNFFNQEAFGTNTSTALFRMWSLKIHDTLEASAADLAQKGIEVNPDMPVHPTFLYESVWCILGFFILNYIVHKHRKFKGEIFMLYGVWYGLERMVVEGLRTDSLYIANTNIRVSQLLSLIIVLVALTCLIINFVRLKKGTLPERLKIVPVENTENNTEKNTENENVTNN
ncbi:MAG: prolipoprotein diacylglyceryl transferase [Eubacterium sp.]